jgi:hypothetical protein
MNDSTGSTMAVDYSGRGFHASLVNGPSFVGNNYVQLVSASSQFLTVPPGFGRAISSAVNVTGNCGDRRNWART